VNVVAAKSALIEAELRYLRFDPPLNQTKSSVDPTAFLPRIIPSVPLVVCFARHASDHVAPPPPRVISEVSAQGFWTLLRVKARHGSPAVSTPHVPLLSAR